MLQGCIVTLGQGFMANQGIGTLSFDTAQRISMIYDRWALSIHLQLEVLRYIFKLFPCLVSCTPWFPPNKHFVLTHFPHLGVLLRRGKGSLLVSGTMVGTSQGSILDPICSTVIATGSQWNLRSEHMEEHVLWAPKMPHSMVTALEAEHQCWHHLLKAPCGFLPQRTAGGRQDAHLSGKKMVVGALLSTGGGKILRSTPSQPGWLTWAWAHQVSSPLITIRWCIGNFRLHQMGWDETSWPGAHLLCTTPSVQLASKFGTTNGPTDSILH